MEFIALNTTVKGVKEVRFYINTEDGTAGSVKKLVIV